MKVAFKLRIFFCSTEANKRSFNLLSCRALVCGALEYMSRFVRPKKKSGALSAGMHLGSWPLRDGDCSA